MWFSSSSLALVCVISFTSRNYKLKEAWEPREENLRKEKDKLAKLKHIQDDVEWIKKVENDVKTSNKLGVLHTSIKAKLAELLSANNA